MCLAPTGCTSRASMECTSLVPKVRGPKLRGGLLLGVVMGGAVYLWTGDAFAAGQTLNPAANTTDAVVSGRGTVGEVAIGLIKDLVSLSPPGAIALLIWDLGQPRGDFMYDQKLADKAISEGRDPFCAQCHGPGAQGLGKVADHAVSSARGRLLSAA